MCDESNKLKKKIKKLEAWVVELFNDEKELNAESMVLAGGLKRIANLMMAPANSVEAEVLAICNEVLTPYKERYGILDLIPEE